jgi:hypothetical protein
MNLIEAIKSGKRFRRTSWDSIAEWIDPRTDRLNISLDAIIADDWDVEPQPVTITREQFDKAWFSATGKSPGSSGIYEALAKELGL